MVNVKNIGFPDDRVTLHPAPSGITFLRFEKASWDTAHLHEITTNRYDYAFCIDAVAGAVISHVWYFRCVFDYGKTREVRRAVNAIGALIGSFVFAGGWAVALDG